jgi:glycosyltransferase involved in cell wall biosynthesis
MKILLATYDLCPPWDSGHKVYGKGLLDSIKMIEDVDITTVKSLNNGTNLLEDRYDYVHVVLAGSEPLTKALRTFKKARIIKHILTPSIGYRSSVSTKIYYAIVQMVQSRLIRCFSSDFVANSYFMNADLIIPPPIDTTVFVSSPKVEEDEIISILENCSVKVGVGNIKGNSNSLILFSGPLTADRFPYQIVLRAISDTRSKILIIGRTSNNGPGQEKVQEIINYARKLNIENRVTIVLKSLSEEEKVKLINYCDAVIQPFAKYTQQFVAVDPPFFLLESMACGKPVITSKTYSFEHLITNGSNGYAIDWKNPGELDIAITDCVSNRQMAAAARTTITQNFSLQHVSKKLKGIYDDYQ